MRPLLCSALCGRALLKDRRRFGWSNWRAAPPPWIAIRFPSDGQELDFRPLLEAVVWDRLRNRPPCRDRPRIPARHRHRRGGYGRSTLREPRGGYGCALRRGLPERALARGSSIASRVPPAGNLDQPRSATKRRRHQPGSGCASCVRSIQRCETIDHRGPDPCMSFRSP